jgi:hypothetical protein
MSFLHWGLVFAANARFCIGYEQVGWALQDISRSFEILPRPNRPALTALIIESGRRSADNGRRTDSRVVSS